MKQAEAKSMIPAPPINMESKSFWDSANEGRLVLGYCQGCEQWHYYPRSICPLCHSSGATLRDSAGYGQIYSCSATLRGAAEPYVVAYVELDEGPRIFSNIVGSPPLEVRIGQRVEVCFLEAEGGQMVPMFKLAAST